MHLKDIEWKSVAWIRVAGWCEHDNEQLGYMACGDFVDQVNNC